MGCRRQAWESCLVTTHWVMSTPEGGMYVPPVGVGHSHFISTP